MLRFSKKEKFRNFSLKEIKESDEKIEKISFVEMESSKLVNYLTNMVLMWPRYYGNNTTKTIHHHEPAAFLVWQVQTSNHQR
jgi:hypothetical protein